MEACQHTVWFAVCVAFRFLAQAFGSLSASHFGSWRKHMEQLASEIAHCTCWDISVSVPEASTLLNTNSQPKKRNPAFFKTLRCRDGLCRQRVDGRGAPILRLHCQTLSVGYLPACLPCCSLFQFINVVTSSRRHLARGRPRLTLTDSLTH